ncbi:integrase catalytic domain-containing protein [Trichonephila clavata]|uniref:Integrase catalytic domain-containing protein n=1 Tax=Trichonephila clavata TaxID=2740835 RepID=A0A8X6I060_TRICU|nr:integrase catalytic domain-containing protein [Trichonephila clavata]
MWRELLPIINKCSSFVKLKRIIAWCLRFKENARNPPSQRTIGSLTATELSRALICLVRNVQSVHFPLEIQCLLRVNAKAKNQVMADLSSNRVKVSRVFTKVGIDYAGPFFIKLYPGTEYFPAEIEEAVKDHFVRSLRRDDEGRYKVSLPWLEVHPELSDNRNIAERRLKSCVRSLEKRNCLQEYENIFKEWDSEKIIEPVEPEEFAREKGHFLPH